MLELQRKTKKIKFLLQSFFQAMFQVNPNSFQPVKQTKSKHVCGLPVFDFL